uniref:Ripply transcriptional repressor 2 n=1 Tax=Chinchilla lanigera TaxID=34839 RepID=A0A8C2VUB1_CHILA
PPHSPRAGLRWVLPGPGSRLLRAAVSPPRRSAGFWRPWEARGEQEHPAQHHRAEAVSAVAVKHTLLSASFRLLWPKSKCYDYLYQEAETLLKNFPIQATISFYEDSDSEDEIQELACEN